MSQPRVKWKQARKYFKRRGYVLRPSGGDTIIVPPRENPGKRHSRAPVCIGHKFSNTPNAELLNVHLKRIHDAFGVTREDLLNA